MSHSRAAAIAATVVLVMSVVVGWACWGIFTRPDLTQAQVDRLVVGPVEIPEQGLDVAWIEIQQGSIRSIRTNARLAHGRNQPDSIGSGLIATSGMTDQHVHYPPGFFVGHADLFNTLFLRHGITTVREMGSIGADISEMKREIADGERPGPRITTCGVPITGSDEILWSPFLLRVADEESVRGAVQQNALNGARCIKLYRGFPASLLDAVTDEAEKYRLPVIGHLPIDAPWDETRVSDIQHVCDPRCSKLRDSSIRALANTAATGRISHTPTLVAFHSPRPSPSKTWNDLPRLWRDELWSVELLSLIGLPEFEHRDERRRTAKRVTTAVGELLQHGTRIQIGTDTGFPGVVPGSSYYDEMAYLSQAGMGIDEIWDAAVADHDVSGRRGLSGGIYEGAPADILLFRKDPTLALENLDSLEYVIAAGRLYSVQELDDHAKRLREYADSAIVGGSVRWTVAALHCILRWWEAPTEDPSR